MKKWSLYFQTPAFMELTRKNLILEEFRPLVVNWCGIQSGMNVLDVGCGTGYFTRFLGDSGLDIRLTGLDIDDIFIETAKKMVGSDSRYRFLLGDALALPFEDNTFDVVVSHTFFTSVPHPEKALAEMKRVCKKRGCIASITTMAFQHAMYSRGHYPVECTWEQSYNALFEKMWAAYERINPFANYINHLSTAELPHLLHKEGLEQICAYPIGKLVSFSNAAFSKTDRLEYLELLMASEEQRLTAYLELPEFTALFTKKDAELYLGLLKQKCNYLKDHIDDNSIWEWNGGANVLVTGINP